RDRNVTGVQTCALPISTTPTLSEALAVTLVVPPTVAPETGEVMLTVGGVVSLNTVTVTAAEVVRLPAASRATAVSVCEPLLAVRSEERRVGKECRGGCR